MAVVAFVVLGPSDADEDADDRRSRPPTTPAQTTGQPQTPTATAPSAPAPAPEDDFLKAGRTKVSGIVVSEGKTVRLVVKSDGGDKVHLPQLRHGAAFRARQARRASRSTPTWRACSVETQHG